MLVNLDKFHSDYSTVNDTPGNSMKTVTSEFLLRALVGKYILARENRRNQFQNLSFMCYIVYELSAFSFRSTQLHVFIHFEICQSSAYNSQKFCQKINVENSPIYSRDRYLRKRDKILRDKLLRLHGTYIQSCLINCQIHCIFSGLHYLLFNFSLNPGFE